MPPLERSIPKQDRYDSASYRHTGRSGLLLPPISLGLFDQSLLTKRTSSGVRGLNEIAAGRGQSLAQEASAWTLRDPRVTSTLVGVSSLEQLDDNLKAWSGSTSQMTSWRRSTATPRRGT